MTSPTEAAISQSVLAAVAAGNRLCILIREMERMLPQTGEMDSYLHDAVDKWGAASYRLLASLVQHSAAGGPDGEPDHD